MGIMVMDTALSSRYVALIMLGSLSFGSLAGEVNFSPKLLFKETYTDNVDLNKSNKQSSYVNQTGIGLSAIYYSQNLKFDWQSESTYASYTHDHSIDDDYHTLSSNLSWVLWPKGITFSASATIENVSRNSGTNSLADIVSGDTIRLESYQSGFNYDVTNSDFLISSNLFYSLTNAEDRIGEREGLGYSLSTKNGNSARHIYWEGSASLQDLKNGENDAEFHQAEFKLGWLNPYKFHPFFRYYNEDNKGTVLNNRPYETSAIGFGIKWLVSDSFYIESSYNKPSGNELDTDGNELKNYFDLVLNWQPTSRTRLTASKSQRFYGDSYSFDFTHKIKRLENKISYDEQVEAFTRNNLEPYIVGIYLCAPGESEDLTNCFISSDEQIDFQEYELVTLTDFNILEDRSYSLNKVLSWSTSYNLSRTTFTLSFIQSRRSNLDEAYEDRIETASFTVNRTISGYSNISLNIRYNDSLLRENLENERADKYIRYNIEYEKQLNSSLDLTLGMSTLKRESSFSQFNYRENRVHLSLTKEF